MDAITDTTTRYYYDDAQRVLLETDVDASETDVRYFVYGNYIDEVLVMRDVDSTNTVPDGDYFYGHDHLYSVVCLFGAAGNPAERYEYDAYGKVRVLDADFTDDADGLSDVGNPYTFTGRRLDSLDSGRLVLMYYRTRTYDPETGRFLQPDPLGIDQIGGTRNSFNAPKQYEDGMNVYEYVSSNSISFIDPFGLTSCGCTVKRAKADMVISGSFTINAGHEWISCGSDSIGFWPNRDWIIISPDPAEIGGVPAYEEWELEMDKGWFGEKSLKWGSGAGKKCCQASCGDITSCIMASPNPGWRSCSIINNCRRYAQKTISGCCLKKGRKTVNPTP